MPFARTSLKYSPCATQPLLNLESSQSSAHELPLYAAPRAARVHVVGHRDGRQVGELVVHRRRHELEVAATVGRPLQPQRASPCANDGIAELVAASIVTAAPIWAPPASIHAAWMPRP